MTRVRPFSFTMFICVVLLTNVDAQQRRKRVPAKKTDQEQQSKRSQQNNKNDEKLPSLPGAKGPRVEYIGKPPGGIEIVKVYVVEHDEQSKSDSIPQVFPSGTSKLRFEIQLQSPVERRPEATVGFTIRSSAGFVRLSGAYWGSVAMGTWASTGREISPQDGSFPDGPYQLELTINGQKVALLNWSIGDAGASKAETQRTANRPGGQAGRQERGTQERQQDIGLPNEPGLFYRHEGVYQALPKEDIEGADVSLIISARRKRKLPVTVQGRASRFSISEKSPRFLVHLLGQDASKLKLYPVAMVSGRRRVVKFLTVEKPRGFAIPIVDVSRPKDIALVTRKNAEGYLEIELKRPLISGEYLFDVEDGGTWSFSIRIGTSAGRKVAQPKS